MKRLRELTPTAQSALQAALGVLLLALGVGWAFGPGFGVAAFGVALYLDYAVRAVVAAKGARNDDPV